MADDAPPGTPDGPAPRAPRAAVRRPGARRALGRWRGRRPFWGGVLLTLGGAETLLTEKASLKVVLHIGMQGLAGYLLPVLMALCGLLILFHPAQRLFYSLVGVLVSLGSWLTSNLGGFLVGLLLGVTGSCLAFGWLPDQEPRRRHRPGGRVRERDPAPAPTSTPPPAPPASAG
ncbi:DUF6114 domain-containing protein [Streptomyces tropicalis]|uniref:DUF6114 domain-containing protein n=1 Tax=Streptomyces tropicalis TaxID=3034234 RepID=A0ABT6A1H9_9ACTN|nr:DUF6114 domain-containing protein [Streptomyces tropicalis]MDF3298493.1 DUF6114 domain-containing protein [Streptomyces tropicalis]